jgi:hypothetical protein
MNFSPLELEDDSDSPRFTRRIARRLKHGSASGFQKFSLRQIETRLDGRTARSVPSPAHYSARDAFECGQLLSDERSIVVDGGAVESAAALAERKAKEQTAQAAD